MSAKARPAPMKLPHLRTPAPHAHACRMRIRPSRRMKTPPPTCCQQEDSPVVVVAGFHQCKGQPSPHEAAPLAHALREAKARGTAGSGGEVTNEGITRCSLHKQTDKSTMIHHCWGVALHVWCAVSADTDTSNAAHCDSNSNFDCTWLPTPNPLLLFADPTAEPIAATTMTRRPTATAHPPAPRCPGGRSPSS